VDVDAISAALMKDPAPAERLRRTDGTAPAGLGTSGDGDEDPDPVVRFNSIPLPAQLREISDAEYAAERRANPNAKPLNPEQRKVAAELYRIVKYRDVARRQGQPPAEIDRDLQAARRTGVVFLTGAGGTGKSQVIACLRKLFADEGLGRIVVTAFTGVAAAVFGAPTLLTLFGQGIEDKAQKPLPDLTPEFCLKAEATFMKHSGVDPQDVALMVIDEVSFNDDAIFGHVERHLRALVRAPHVPCGGIPFLLAGDNMQKRPAGAGAVPWYKRLAMDARPYPHTASAAGLAVLKSARRFLLTRIMRSDNDEVFTRCQNALRDLTVQFPITASFLKHIKKLSIADMQDPRWRFAPIAVMSRVERDKLNMLQLVRFAEYFDLPLFRWRKPLPNYPVTASMSDAEVDDLYENEPNMWNYFVEGAPGLLTENIKSTRGLVNGTPFLYDSLDFQGAVPEKVLAAYAEGRYPGHPITLDHDERPHAIFIRVGSTDQNPHFWHGVQLEDLSRQLVDTGMPRDVNDEWPQIIPISTERVVSAKDAALVFSGCAVQHGLKKALRMKEYPIMLAFAMTDFKLQGRTLPHLAINIMKRSNWGSAMDLPGFYVMVSRGTSFKALRWLEFDQEEAKRLGKLRWDEFLVAWNQGYDEGGAWSDDRARAALRDETRRRNGQAPRGQPAPRRRGQQRDGQGPRRQATPSPAPAPAPAPAPIDNWVRCDGCGSWHVIPPEAANTDTSGSWHCRDATWDRLTCSAAMDEDPRPPAPRPPDGPAGPAPAPEPAPMEAEPPPLPPPPPASDLEVPTAHGMTVPNLTCAPGSLLVAQATSELLVPLIYCAAGQVPGGHNVTRASSPEQVSLANQWWSDRISLWPVWCQRVRQVLDANAWRYFAQEYGKNAQPRRGRRDPMAAVPRHDHVVGLLPYMDETCQLDIMNDAGISDDLAVLQIWYDSAPSGRRRRREPSPPAVQSDSDDMADDLEPHAPCAMPPGSAIPGASPPLPRNRGRREELEALEHALAESCLGAPEVLDANDRRYFADEEFEPPVAAPTAPRSPRRRSRDPDAPSPSRPARRQRR
jgi:hypothetical protein